MLYFVRPQNAILLPFIFLFISFWSHIYVLHTEVTEFQICEPDWLVESCETKQMYSQCDFKDWERLAGDGLVHVEQLSDAGNIGLYRVTVLIQKISLEELTRRIKSDPCHSD